MPLLLCRAEPSLHVALYDVSRSDERIALHTVKMNLAAFHHPNKNAGDGKQSRDSEDLILIFDVFVLFLFLDNAKTVTHTLGLYIMTTTPKDIRQSRSSLTPPPSPLHPSNPAVDCSQ